MRQDNLSITSYPLSMRYRLSIIGLATAENGKMVTGHALENDNRQPVIGLGATGES